MANAKTAAEAKTFNGLSGYLATIESADENAFIFSKISQNAWIGASIVLLIPQMNTLQQKGLGNGFQDRIMVKLFIVN